MSTLQKQACIYQVSINGIRPFLINRRQMEALYPAKKSIQRLIYHGLRDDPQYKWIRIVRPGAPGREMLVDTKSFERACERLDRGESLPLMPSERGTIVSQQCRQS